MGVATGDYNGNGLIDIFKTHFSDDLPALYKNSGRDFFDDASRAAGFDHTRYVEWGAGLADFDRSEEHTSELQSRLHLVCRLLLEKKKKKNNSLIRDYKCLSRHL